MDKDRIIYIYYRNHRGESSWRQITPGWMYFGSTKWHPEQQWLMIAYDHDKQADRDFALRDILEWRTDLLADRRSTTHGQPISDVED